MTQLKITTIVSVALVAALATSHAAQAQQNKRQKLGANPSHAVTPDKPRSNHSKPASKPRFAWKKLWTKPNAKEITVDGIDGTCRTGADATLEASEKGVVNVGTEMQRLSCRVSLAEPGKPYQVSVLMDHTASEKFECAAGPLKASRRYGRQTDQSAQAQDSVSSEELEESPGADRDEWQFLSSRRLNTISVRCRIPAGGVVSEVTLTDCSVDKCSTADGS